MNEPSRYTAEPVHFSRRNEEPRLARMTAKSPSIRREFDELIPIVGSPHDSSQSRALSAVITGKECNLSPCGWTMILEPGLRQHQPDSGILRTCSPRKREES